MEIVFSFSLLSHGLDSLLIFLPWTGAWTPVLLAPVARDDRHPVCACGLQLRQRDGRAAPHFADEDRCSSCLLENPSQEGFRAISVIKFN